MPRAAKSSLMNNYKRQVQFLRLFMTVYPEWLNTKQVVVSLGLDLEPKNYRMVNRHAQVLIELGVIETDWVGVRQSVRVCRLSPQMFNQGLKIQAEQNPNTGV